MSNSRGTGAVIVGVVMATVVPSVFLTACGGERKDCSDHATSSEECYECLGAVDRGSSIELTECDGATSYHFRINETCECN